MAIKTHQAVRGTVADPDALRSPCGRSSGRVWNVETIEAGQNVGERDEVNCKFCLNILATRQARAA